MKIALIYSYDGSKFCGSQTQPNLNAVEDKLNLALNRVGIFQKVISSSRTDKNVHALNQVSTTEIGDFFHDLNHLKNLINHHAKPYIFIKKIMKVDEKFQVRFDAKARSYRYILNHNDFNPFLSDYFNFCKKQDLKNLNIALKIFEGKHDFTEFKKEGSIKENFVREIYQAFAYRYKNFTIIKFKANGFLRMQVRFMVANALKFANGDENFIKINTKNSKSNFYLKAITRIPAPANGLYLHKIFY